MEKDEAIAILARMESLKRALGEAPRTTKLSRAVGDKHRDEAKALAVAIQALGSAHDLRPLLAYIANGGAKADDPDMWTLVDQALAGYDSFERGKAFAEAHKLPYPGL